MIRVREFRGEELAQIVKIINEAYKGSYEFIPYTEDSLLDEIRRRSLEILVAEEDGEIKGLISYRHRRKGERIHFLCVKECENKDETEDLLLKEAEKFAVGEEISISLDAERIDYEKWARRGYKPEGGQYHMIAELKEVKPLPPVPEGFILRSLREGEEEEMIKTVNTAYGGERLAPDSIQRWKAEDPEFNEEWIHVAEYNEKIVSVVVSRRDIEYNEYFGGRRGYLGPAATLSEFRGKGLASALTQKAMNFLFMKGMDSVALYTGERNQPSVHLLKKLGFKVAHHWKTLVKRLNPAEDSTG